MSNKAPSFQFYPEDWLSNVKLQLCSMTAQGLLINLMCLMHQSEKYGYLLINGSQTNHKQLIKLLRMHHKTFNKALSELISCGVLKEDENGVLYCKRMVDDNRLREIRREAGKLGGNPHLVKGKVKQKVKQDDNQNPTPSSPPSSSPPPTIKDKVVSLLSLFEKYESDFTTEELKLKKAFLKHWTEKNEGGKKERWQMEKVFDVKRRFRTWIVNEIKWNKKTEPEKATAISPEELPND